jgi:hypothetical protein
MFMFPKVTAKHISGSFVPVAIVVSWDQTEGVLSAKPAAEDGMWEPGVLHEVTLDHTAFVIHNSLREGMIFRFTTSLEIPIENFTPSDQMQVFEFQDTMTKIENDQLVQLEASLMAVDHALVTQKLDEKVQRPSYERPDQPGQLMDVVLEELKRIKKELGEAFGEDFDLDRLLEAKK